MFEIGDPPKRRKGGGVAIRSGGEDYYGASQSDCFLFFIFMGSHWKRDAYDLFAKFIELSFGIYD
jgi:hypothetical protein